MAEPALWDDTPEVQSRPGGPMGDTRPAPGWWETAGAAARTVLDSVPILQKDRLTEAYAQIGPELAKRNGVGRTEYWTHDIWTFDPLHPWDGDRIWKGIEAARAIDPEAFKDLGTRQDFERGTLRRDGGRDRDLATVARGPASADIVGNIAGTMLRPENLGTLPVGGVGRGIGMKILTEGLAQGGITALAMPGYVDGSAALGEDITPREMAEQIGGAVVGGAVLRGVGEVAAPVVRAAAGKAADAVAPVGRMLEERQLIRDFEKAVPPEARTPEQIAALQVVRRGAEIDEASPFHGTHSGYGWNEARLARAEADLLHGGEPARPVPAAPARPFRAFDQASAMRLTLELEGGSKLVTDSGGLTKWGISAKGNPGVDIAGLSQGQAEAIYRRKYLAPLDLSGRSHEAASVAFDASVNHGPAFAKRLLRVAGDDPAKMIALRRGEYARLIRENPGKYGRYAKGWENRLRRLESELGLRPGGDGPMMGGRAIEAVDDDLTRALEIEGDDIAAAAARADNDLQAALSRVEDMDDEAAMAAIEAAAPVPVLRAEEFPDRNSWRVAQAELEAEALGLTEPVVTRATIWEDARERLLEAKAGEEAGALFHPEVGPIDVKWGKEGTGKSDGFGLSKIARFHPEVMDDLPSLLDEMSVVSRSENRIKLESDDHVASVRLDWDGKRQRWLVTAYRRDPKRAATRTRAKPAGKHVRSEEDISPLVTDDGRATDDARTGNFSARGDEADIGDAAGNGKALDAFDDPAGEGVRATADSDWHDIRAAMADMDPNAKFDLGDGQGERSAAEILRELDDEAADLDALKACGLPGMGGDA